MYRNLSIAWRGVKFSQHRPWWICRVDGVRLASFRKRAHAVEHLPVYPVGAYIEGPRDAHRRNRDRAR